MVADKALPLAAYPRSQQFGRNLQEQNRLVDDEVLCHENR